MNIIKSDVLLNILILREPYCQTLQWKKRKIVFLRQDLVWSFFFINPIAAVTGNEPESLRQLRQLRNYVEPKVTMSFSDTQQN